MKCFHQFQVSLCAKPSLGTAVLLYILNKIKPSKHTPMKFRIFSSWFYFNSNIKAIFASMHTNTCIRVYKRIAERVQTHTHTMHMYKSEDCRKSHQNRVPVYFLCTWVSLFFISINLYYLSKRKSPQNNQNSFAQSFSKYIKLEMWAKNNLSKRKVN